MSRDERRPSLTVRGLQVHYGPVEALRGVDLDLQAGRSVAVIGESGAGKSTLVRAVGGLLVAPGVPAPTRTAGSVSLGAQSIPLDEAAPTELRAAQIAVLPQRPSLEPLWPAVENLREPLRAAGRPRLSHAQEVARFAQVGLEERTLGLRPQQLSGGQARRVALACALALDPQVLVLDEPTAGLDPATAADLLQLTSTVVAERGLASLVVTHELSVAARAAELLVLYAGRVVEQGNSTEVLHRARHPYTAALIGSTATLTSGKDLRPIRGRAPAPQETAEGCAFHPRCVQAVPVCASRPVGLDEERHRVACHLGGVVTRLRATDLRVVLSDDGLGKPAVDAVSLVVRAGEALGIAGASGSGKTTLARALSGHLRPARGRVAIDGDDPVRDPLARRRVQLVQQDPWLALPPGWTVEEALHEPIALRRDRTQAAAAREQISDVLEAVGLQATPWLLASDPVRLSGGQVQRIALARALLAEPTVLVADEPTSMLDPSERARLALTLRDLQVERGLALVIVSHDLPLLRKTTDRLLVLDEGRPVEEHRTDAVLRSPRHGAARALVAASSVTADRQDVLELKGDPT